jgi:hypothetical protein
LRKINILIATTTITILLIAVLIVYPLTGQSQLASSIDDLRQLVSEEMRDYIMNDTADRTVYSTEMIITTHHVIQYDMPGKGSVKLGDAFFFMRFDDFLKQLSNRTDPVGYIKQLKEELNSPTPEPNATFGGGDPWDYVEPTLSAYQGVYYNYSFSPNTKASFAMSVGLLNNDEAQRVILEIRVIKSSAVDHRVWKRVFHFEQTNGVPGNALSIMGVGETFQLLVTNDDGTSQQFRIYRSYQTIT